MTPEDAARAPPDTEAVVRLTRATTDLRADLERGGEEIVDRDLPIVLRWRRLR